jgi:hypothetical protein
MDPVILYPASARLFPGDDRTGTTFPSGLVRVDQTYYCAASEAAAARTALAVGNAPPDGNTDPAIDGLYIFPDVQEIGSGPGMREFQVSAYGRTRSEMRDITFTQITLRLSNSIRFKAWEIRGKLVLPTGTPLTIDSVTIDPEWLDPFDFFFVSEDWTLQSLVQRSIRYRLMSAASSSSGGYGGYLLPIRAYNVTMKNTVTEATQDFVFTLRDPVWTIENQNNFGAFVEMSIVGDRGELSTATI